MPAYFFRLFRQPESWKSAEKNREYRSQLESCQPRTQAVVHAAAEREVSILLASDIELLGLLETLPVVVGRGKPDEYEVAAWNCDLADGDIFGSETDQAQGDGAFEAQHLLDRRRDQSRRLDQPAPLFGITLQQE